ncbi:hypothetical protein PCH_Pc12g12310 [Penicillium rubens Wisconsin 54-1255]|uniref:Uncharacterized protein n=1 Tax=Penicillium rubens (strain ATCC 28089 / DSM 1075 / NRRL 1951 / Wisconsin 54-1255) TaxID=500485 RepID=B6GYD5_PENRW|nr:hypothetical protein PCH_Pc12g12310 [Penicillium rubens Wisconsin 54-1255]
MALAANSNNVTGRWYSRSADRLKLSICRIRTVHMYSAQTRIGNQSGYRVSRLSDSLSDSAFGDAERLNPKCLSWSFGEFPNVVSRVHAYAFRLKGVFYPKLLHLSDIVAYSLPIHCARPGPFGERLKVPGMKPVTVRRGHFVFRLGCSILKPWSLETAVEPASHWAVMALWIIEQ